MSASDDINIEAGLERDHDLRQLLAVCRYGLAAIALFIGLTSWSCSRKPDPAGHLGCGSHAPCAKWQAAATECQRWTP